MGIEPASVRGPFVNAQGRSLQFGLLVHVSDILASLDFYFILTILCLKTCFSSYTRAHVTELNCS